MEMTYTAIFNRCMDDNNYPALMQIDSLVEKDVDAAFEDYQAAITNWEIANAKQLKSNDGVYDYALDVAYLEMQRKYVAYLEKHMLHSCYHEFYKI